MPDAPSRHLREIGLVAAGGALGSLARWGLAVVLPAPAGTLVANLAGCFAIGVLAAWLFVRHPRVRLFAGVGVLGGFTTFSTSLLDTQALLDRPALATAYAGGTLLSCLALAGLGLAVGERLPGAPP